MVRKKVKTQPKVTAKKASVKKDSSLQQKKKIKVKKNKKVVGVRKAMPIDAETVFDNPESMVDTSNLKPVSKTKAGKKEAKAVVALNKDIDPDDTKENRDLLERVREGVRHMETVFWELSKNIAEVNSKKIYKLLNYKTFPEYLNEEIGIDRNKGYYLQRTHLYFNNELKGVLADQPELYDNIIEKVKNIGWTKASRLATDKIITPENAEEVIERITQVNEAGRLPSVKDVERLCKQVFSQLPEETKDKKIEENSDKTVPYNFRLTLAQEQDVRSALDLVTNMKSGDMTKSSKLSWICRDFHTTNIKAKGGDVKLEDVLDRMSAFFECDLVAIDRKSEKVIYGEEGVGVHAKELLKTIDKVIETDEDDSETEAVQA